MYENKVLEGHRIIHNANAAGEKEQLLKKIINILRLFLIVMKKQSHASLKKQKSIAICSK